MQGGLSKWTRRRRSAVAAALALALPLALAAWAHAAHREADTDEEAVTTSSPPHASFTVSPSVIGTGRTVTLTSTSTPGDSSSTITSQQWDLNGDGRYGDATGSTATTTFATTGSHTVGLKVTDSHDNTATATRTLTVYSPPTASISQSPSTPGPGQTITFTANASDPDGQITSRAWDLDLDGAFDDGTGTTATTRFSTTGDHTVKVRVTDSQGLQTTASRLVHVYQPPTAAFSFTPTQPADQQPITFSSTSTDADGRIVSQAWDLDGDGAFDDGTAATATAHLPAGTHRVSLRVTDSQGLTAVVSHDIVVAAATPVNQPPTAAFDYSPTAPHVGDAISLSASASDPDGDPVTLDWDLNGDNDFSDAAGPTATATFTTPGGHLVALRATDSNGASVVAFETIDVLPIELPLVASPSLGWITPFPVLRIAGTAQRGFTLIRVFSVLAPGGTRFSAACRGHGCPARSFRRRNRANRPLTPFRVRVFERRIPAGSTITASVLAPGLIGKYTRLRFRSLKPPERLDACMLANRPHPFHCPPRS